MPPVELPEVAVFIATSLDGYIAREGGELDWLFRRDFEDDMELLLSYSAQGLYEAGRVQFGAGLTGRMIVSEKDLNLAERSFHQLGLALVSVFGRFHPGLHLRIPVDSDLNDALDFVFGLNVTMMLK